jgi:dynamin family protein
MSQPGATAAATASSSVADDVLAAATRLVEQAPDDSTRADAQAIVERLRGPLRVAIAGRVKAGKSTLLNALVGERLAPTDAGECTRLVTAYRRGAGYEVTARMIDGTVRSLAFNRAGGALAIELGSATEADIDRLDVSWPTSSLETVTLIDTPGLESVHDENSRRTRDFLEADADGPGDADAVVYLMRHAHRSDVAFLDAFMDRSVTAASPVNAVAVLSRADEIGAGRLDAMASAARIADRYAADPQLRNLCATVVPLAGLIAETGLTLREDEAAALRTLAATDPAVLEQMLMSAEQFCEMSNSALTVEWRRDLLDRLGLFGVRLAVEEIRAGRATTAAQLGAVLVDVSGLQALRSLFRDHFAPRARVLQARSALLSLRALVRRLPAESATLAADIDRDLERIEASTTQFARIRALHLLGSGLVSFSSAADADEVRTILVADAPEDAFAGGTPQPVVSQESLRSAALTAITKWRTRAADPLADPTTVELCDTVVRCCESFYARTAAG